MIRGRHRCQPVFLGWAFGRRCPPFSLCSRTRVPRPCTNRLSLLDEPQHAYPCHLPSCKFALRLGFQNFDTAFRMSTAFAPDIIHCSGYLIPEFLMRRRLSRIDYINSSYSLAGIMESEFSRISLVCEGSFVVPRYGPGMGKRHNVVEPNQAYTLHCVQPGLGTVSGADYIKAGYLLDINDLRRNFFVGLG